MNIEILKYQYHMGALSIQDLITLVEKQEITEEHFHDITRKNYKGFRKNQKLRNEEDFKSKL